MPSDRRSYSHGRKPTHDYSTRRESIDPPEVKQQPPQPKQHPSVSKHPSNSDADVESITSSVSKYLHLPKLPHRPTKEELLAAANGFWERLKVRFKWMSIRSMRPWNADEWGAFVSWFMLGHIVWILVGTTTFFSLLIFSINTVFAQGKRWAGI
jgi:distribution and morphology protein 31